MDFGIVSEIGISRLALTYSGWFFGGVFTGFHWLAFVPDICYNQSGYYGLFTKCTIVGHILSYWMCNIGMGKKNKRRTVGQKQVILGYLIIPFPMSSGVSERANK